MKIKNLSEDLYNQELEEILKGKGIIGDEQIFIGYRFDDSTFESVEELNGFIDENCICLSDDEYTYFVYKRSAIMEKTGSLNYPEDYNVERIRNDNVDFPYPNE